MKIYCPENTLASSIMRRIIFSSSHSLVEDISQSDFGINLLRFSNNDPRMFSINPGTTWLEFDKSKAYDFFNSLKINVPTYSKFQDVSYEFPYVVKFISSSSLGPQTVVVKDSSDLNLLRQSINSYGNNALIQEYVSGREFTVTILAGEKNWVTVGVAQDFKTLDSNININTFGMGSISPVPINKDVNQVIDKVLNELKTAGVPYRGFLSFQFLENESLWLLECNVRLCMPEFQSMSKLIDASEFINAIYNAHVGNTITELSFKKVNSVTVNLVHSGFPKGELIQIEYPKTDMEIITDKSNGMWCNRTFIAGVNNFGNKTFDELSKEIYNYLDIVKDERCFYRKII